MFEELAELDDYELIRRQFKPLRIDVKHIEIKALFTMRDEFAAYFKVEKRDILLCLLDFFKDDFFLLMPIYSTLNKIYNDMNMGSFAFHINLYKQSTKEDEKYNVVIPGFLSMICNLK